MREQCPALKYRSLGIRMGKGCVLLQCSGKYRSPEAQTRQLPVLAAQSLFQSTHTGCSEYICFPCCACKVETQLPISQRKGTGRERREGERKESSSQGIWGTLCKISAQDAFYIFRLLCICPGFNLKLFLPFFFFLKN